MQEQEKEMREGVKNLLKDIGVIDDVKGTPGDDPGILIQNYQDLILSITKNIGQITLNTEDEYILTLCKNIEEETLKTAKKNLIYLCTGEES